MIIEGFDEYRDGGTISVRVCDNGKWGIYCIDNRIKSKTKGCLYKGYPQEDNSNIVVDSKELEERICVGLNEYKRELENTCMRIGLFLKSKE